MPTLGYCLVFSCPASSAPQIWRPDLAGDVTARAGNAGQQSEGSRPEPFENNIKNICYFPKHYLPIIFLFSPLICEFLLNNSQLKTIKYVI